MRFRCVVTDLDGTFLTSKKTFDEARFQKIYDILTAKGVKFVICTGNQLKTTEQYFQNVNIDQNYIVENGGQIIDHGKEIFTHTIRRSLSQRLIPFLDRRDDLVTVLCGKKSAYVSTHKPENYKKVISLYYKELQFVNDVESVDDDYFKLSLLTEEKYMDQIKSDVFEDFPGEGIEVITSGNIFMDIMPDNVNKGIALKEYLSNFNIDPAECMAFGDSDNDIEMLKYAGESFAMERSSPGVIAAAKYRAPSNETGGVLDVLEDYLKRDLF